MEVYEPFRDKEKFETHLKTWCVCSGETQITRSLPVSDEGSPVYAKFTKPAHLHRHPARVYADSETFERGGINHAISYAWVLASHGWKAPINRFLNIGEDCAESF